MLSINKITTLCYIINDRSEVLLTMKKKGFGVGKWNGAGGKVQAGETPLAAAVRETREEVGLEIETPMALGFLEFIWPDEQQEWNQRCYIYLAKKYAGCLCESDECRPQWFPCSQLPYEQMWDDDKHWYPRMLSGQKVKIRFYFDQNGQVRKMEEINNS